MPHIRPENGTHLPNTLMLELYLESHRIVGLDRAAKSKAIRRIIGNIAAFAAKFRDTAYSLCSEAQLNQPDQAGGKLSALLARATQRQEIPLEFVSRADLANGTRQEHERLSTLTGTNERIRRAKGRLENSVRRRQLHLLRLAMKQSLRRYLPEMKRSGTYTDAEGRTLANIVSLSIGTRPLLDSLDCGFGNAFAHVFKDDIVALWTSICVALLEGNLARMNTLLSLAEQLRRTFPILRLDEGDIHPMIRRKIGTGPRWLMMTA